ncbi:carboxypeptidase-like regulatory domain-containing protein [Flavobacterium sp. SH_e]|uniref:carboxypeptidase-like regulatory domain-containing protein n=1 Tax=Flavobacterium sp. SH_e TaxID=2983767 RepID=UPI0021E4E87E|nr:carboxypeptidase-like regulatory domain-containing protein [Flavobacterium sp. SH_e]MCV2485018.1 carboxypeptidase-like regulatory domain-containing protein [Flavobacterium sp. SH_e]
MKNLFFFLVLLFSISCFSQRIAGKVFSNDKVPLSGANIFLDGTTISTSTDENGNFVIEYDPDAKNTLVFSYIGFDNQYVTDIDLKKDIVIYMEIAKNTLKEIVVGNKKDIFTREQRLKIFREYFIGETRNNAKIIIENEDDIHFKYDRQNHVLQAYSDKPLVIINSYLGYKISYDLQKFEVTFGSLSIYSRDVIKSYYAGFSHFEEINNSDLILKRREEAYKGSQINFFRNLANGTWGQDQFFISKNNSDVIPENCFKVSKQGNFTKVEVISQRKENGDKKFVASYDLLFANREESRVIFDVKTFYIYKYGNNSNIEDIIFTGKIAEEKIGEMVSLNYGIN